MLDIRENKELMHLFEEEAQSLLAEIRASLALLKNGSLAAGERPRIMRDLFRCAHTLKSSSRTMGFNNLSAIAIALEEIFKVAKDADVEITIEMIPLLSRGVEACQEFLEQNEVAGYHELLEQLNRLRNETKMGEKQ